MEYPKKFEKIDGETSRLRVPGGWIIRSIIIRPEGIGLHTFFMEDDVNVWHLRESN